MDARPGCHVSCTNSWRSLRRFRAKRKGGKPERSHSHAFWSEKTFKLLAFATYMVQPHKVTEVQELRALKKRHPQKKTQTREQV